MKYNIGLILYVSWSGLGFLRGINSYNYKLKNQNDNYIYTNSLIYGILGFIIYANPVLLPFTLHKEIYRLEINARGIEKKKNTKYYKDL
jgi:hypothetical protein